MFPNILLDDDLTTFKAPFDCALLASVKGISGTEDNGDKIEEEKIKASKLLSAL